MTIISTIDRAGEYDAIATAKPGEPLFPLQGGDQFAPECVLLWARRAREHADVLAAEAEGTRSKRKADKLREQVDHLRRKATSAEEVAWAMQEYQRDEQAPEQTAATSYSGAEHDVERDQIASLSGICDRIYNSIAELTDAADALGKVPEQNFGARAIRTVIVPTLNDIVATVEPRRHLPQREAA